MSLLFEAARHATFVRATFPSLTVRDRSTSSAGNRPPSQIVLAREQSLHPDHPTHQHALETLKQAPRKPDLVQIPREASSNEPPGLTLREDLGPPSFPSSNGRLTCPDHRSEGLHASHSCALREHADEHDSHPQIDTALEEKDRRRCPPLSAPVLAAAKALSNAAFLRQIRWTAPGLARVPAVVEGAFARAALGMNPRCQVAVESCKKKMQCGAPNDRCVQKTSDYVP